MKSNGDGSFHKIVASYMIPSVQIGELSEVAELRWDGASELIRVEGPESRNNEIMGFHLVMNRQSS